MYDNDSVILIVCIFRSVRSYTIYSYLDVISVSIGNETTQIIAKVSFNMENIIKIQQTFTEII